MKKNRVARWDMLVNQCINALYTIVFFFPVIIFWINHSNRIDNALMWILIVSLCVYFIPYRCFSHLQLSKKKSFYRKLYIHKFQDFTQQGRYVRLIIQKLSGTASCQDQKKHLQQLKSQIRAFEVFHVSAFIFFTGTCVVSLSQHTYTLACIIFISNLIYNGIPILIQQYNKLRLSQITRLYRDQSIHPLI
ncbi:MAG: hypothetical protein IRZ01_10985 [Thermoflavifilum aggregans]|nr:hypothetical protein [Thermoflavifilum aggregans]